MLARGVLNRTFRANERNELVGPILEYSSLMIVGAGDTVRSGFALLERERGGSQLLGPGRVEGGGCGVCCS